MTSVPEELRPLAAFRRTAVGVESIDVHHSSARVPSLPQAELAFSQPARVPAKSLLPALATRPLLNSSRSNTRPALLGRKLGQTMVQGSVVPQRLLQAADSVR